MTHLNNGDTGWALIECVSRQQIKVSRAELARELLLLNWVLPVTVGHKTMMKISSNKNIRKIELSENDEDGRVPSVDANEIINHILQISINETRTNDISMCEFALREFFDWGWQTLQSSQSNEDVPWCSRRKSSLLSQNWNLQTLLCEIRYQQQPTQHQQMLISSSSGSIKQTTIFHIQYRIV